MPGFPASTLLGPVNLKKLHQAHQRALRFHNAALRDSFAVAERAAKEYVRNRSRFKRRKPAPRSLKDNTKTRVIRSGSGKILRIRWTKPYAGYVEDGTRPHRISIHEVGGGSGSTRGKALRFKGRDGKWVFRRAVNHPGTRPYRFGIRSAKHAGMVFGKRMRQGMARVALRFR
jgi:hypothetical protein